MVQPLTVHHRDWLDKQPLGKTARQLWKRGYAFDYVSDRQIAGSLSVTQDGTVHAGESTYRCIVVPPCKFMPLETLRTIDNLAAAGATIIFQSELPKNVPGLGNLEERRRQLQEIVAKLESRDVRRDVREVRIGKGRFLVGELEPALNLAQTPRETFVDQGGLLFVRRTIGGEHYYFVCNHGGTWFHGWIAPTCTGASMTLIDLMTGQRGTPSTRTNAQGRTEIMLSMPPAGSIIMRSDSSPAKRSPWDYWQAANEPIVLHGTWKVDFIEGGPTLPKGYETTRLDSWTESGDDETKRFAGTARYRIEFDVPSERGRYRLDLGKVCQSARVRVNGKEVGTLLLAPYQTVIGNLKMRANVLEVEVTNVAANRIRDLDRRHVEWRKFRDINFASIDYKKFDASNWPIYPSGLLGPVTIQQILSPESATVNAR
jgi:hypothetical protein